MSNFKLNGENLDIVSENISKLKELFPEMVNGDNEIDFDAFKEIFESVGEIITDDSEEHYNFTWYGKKEAKKVAKETTTKTLRPSVKDSKNWEGTENIYIEGDNLDALKILLGSYRNRIKMIYIDPPYNTGHDFVYKDSRNESTQEHLESTGQLSEEGFLFENAKTDGKYHSNWLNMMYPRLVLARKLLTDDGIIFISIDDNEFDNLEKICNEIFGEENLVEVFLWNKSSGGSSLSKFSRKDYEYILCYSKNINKIDYQFKGAISKGMGDSSMINQPNRYADLIFPANTIYFTNIASGKINKFTDLDFELHEDLFIEDSYNKNQVKISAKWKWSQEYLDEQLSKNTKIISKSDKLRLRYIKDNSGSIIPPTKSISEKDGVGFTVSGSSEIMSLFGKGYFDYPKPSSLISFLVDMVVFDDSIVLDFFSGSATTAHSVFNLNSKNSSNIQFILIQLPEETDKKSEAYKAGYENICEIGKERIRRAGEKVVKESDNNNLDTGFKVFKIDESNFIPWNPNVTSEDVEQAILSTADNLVQGRSELDLVYELLLKLNMDLNSPVDKTEINGHDIYVIDNGYSLICLENNLDVSIADDLLKLKEDLMVDYCQVILKDESLDDNSSINIYETLKSNDVEFYTI